MVGLIISISPIISMPAALASEVWVQQANGRVSGGTAIAEANKTAKTAPEGAASAAAAGSPTTPATCTQANASSPACYSATQQSRGK
jgi:hypothetical protein